MTKKESLSSDLDLVKELEQLRLKQKLLIDSLKKKENSRVDSSLTEISNKLDFLVSIFKEANSQEGKDEVKIEESINSLSEKVEFIESTFNEKLEHFEKILKKSIQNTKQEPTNLPPKPSFEVENKAEQLSQESTKKKKGWFK